MTKFKAGDSVYLVSHSYGDPMERATIDEVEKVHKNGNFLLVGAQGQYRQSGSRVGDHSYTSFRVIPMNDENTTKYNDAKFRVRRANILSTKIKLFDALSNDEKLELLTKGGL